MADAREVMNIRPGLAVPGNFARRSLQVRLRGTIPAFKLGNRWKFKKSILDSWMENQSLSSESPRPANWVSHSAPCRSRLKECLRISFTTNGPLQHSSFF